MTKPQRRCLQNPGDWVASLWSEMMGLGAVSCEQGTEAELLPNPVYKHSEKKFPFVHCFRCDKCIASLLNKGSLAFREAYRSETFTYEMSIYGVCSKIIWGWRMSIGRDTICCCRWRMSTWGVPFLCKFENFRKCLKFHSY